MSFVIMSQDVNINLSEIQPFYINKNNPDLFKTPFKTPL